MLLKATKGDEKTMAKKKAKKNRRHEDRTTTYIVFATAIFNLICAVIELIKALTG